MYSYILIDNHDPLLATVFYYWAFLSTDVYSYKYIKIVGMELEAHQDVLALQGMGEDLQDVGEGATIKVWRTGWGPCKWWPV